MAVETERPNDVSYFDRNNDINPEEGAKIFSDILANCYKQIIISRFDVNSFIDLIVCNKASADFHSISIAREHILGEDENYIPPQNDIEKTLAEIWQEILGIDRVGMTDDFFALGGHSLMALRLLTKIEKKFGLTISLQALQEEKTIRKLGKIIEKLSTDKKEYSSIVTPLRSGGKKIPLFCLHPVGGTAFPYMHFAKHLNFDCPIYGLHDPSIEHGKLIYGSLEEMASAYIMAIRQVQPKGPYLLCGLSFGATLAVEIARQLQGDHIEVKPLIFFDGWAKFSDAQHNEKLFTETMTCLYKDSLPDGNFIKLSWDRMRLLLNYKIPPINKKIILFKAKDLLPEYKIIDQKYNYWDQYATGEIDVNIISGDHESILDEQNVKTLAEILSIKLTEITEKSSNVSIEELCEI